MSIIINYRTVFYYRTCVNNTIFPIFTLAPITTLGIITVPSPIDEVLEITANGEIIFGNLKCNFFNLLYIFNLTV